MVVQNEIKPRIRLESRAMLCTCGMDLKIDGLYVSKWHNRLEIDRVYEIDISLDL